MMQHSSDKAYDHLCQEAHARVRTTLTTLHLEVIGRRPGEGSAFIQGAVSGILEYACATPADLEPVIAMIQETLAHLRPQISDLLEFAVAPAEGRA